MWDDLSKIAIVGTERKPIPDAMLLALQHLGISTAEASPAEVVLKGLATHHLLRKGSGNILQNVDYKPVPPYPCTDALRHCPLFVEDIIHKILTIADFHEAMLPELMRWLWEQNIAFPRQYVPMLLEKCYRDVGFMADVTDYLDEHVAWVASLHPRWKCILPDSMDEWDTSPYLERQKWLQQGIRLLDNEARFALSDGWATEKPDHKVRFLEILSDHITMDDLELLTAALVDGQQTVRTKAAQYIRTLSNNLYTAKAEAFFEQHYAPFLRGDNGVGDMLGVALSDENAPDIQYFKSFLDKYRKPDWRWHVFLQVLSAIPPARLALLTGQPLVAIIKKVRVLEQYQAVPFIAVATDLAAAFGSLELCKALLEECSDMFYHHEHHLWCNEVFSKLLLSLEGKAWEEMMAFCLSKNYNFAWKALAERPGAVSPMHIAPILLYLKAQGQQTTYTQKSSNALFSSLVHKLAYAADASLALQEIHAFEEAYQCEDMDFIRELKGVLGLRVEILTLVSKLK